MLPGVAQAEALTFTSVWLQLRPQLLHHSVRGCLQLCTFSAGLATRYCLCTYVAHSSLCFLEVAPQLLGRVQAVKQHTAISPSACLHTRPRHHNRALHCRPLAHASAAAAAHKRWRAHGRMSTTAWRHGSVQSGSGSTAKDSRASAQPQPRQHRRGALCLSFILVLKPPRLGADQPSSCKQVSAVE